MVEPVDDVGEARRSGAHGEVPGRAEAVSVATTQCICARIAALLAIPVDWRFSDAARWAVRRSEEPTE
jgi:hypothetical protein